METNMRYSITGKLGKDVKWLWLGSAVAMTLSFAGCAESHSRKERKDALSTPVEVDSGPTYYIADDGDVDGPPSVAQSENQQQNPNVLMLPATERTLDYIKDMPPEQLVEIGIELEEVWFDFSAMQDADDNQRAAIINERQLQLAPMQDALIERVEAAGGEELSRSWLTNVVDVRIPAGNVASILSWPNVVQLFYNEPIFPEAHRQPSGFTVSRIATTLAVSIQGAIGVNPGC